MGITLSWDEQHSHIIQLSVNGSWTWEEFYNAMSAMHKEMDASEQTTVDFILDLRNGNKMPSNLLSNMRQVSNRKHPKSGRMIVVGAGRFAELMFDVMGKVLPERMKQIDLVETMEEAYELIAAKTPQVKS